MVKARIIAGAFGGLFIGINATIILFGRSMPNIVVPVIGVCAGIGLLAMALNKAR